jgi:hypothetical protein
MPLEVRDRESFRASAAALERYVDAVKSCPRELAAEFADNIEAHAPRVADGMVDDLPLDMDADKLVRDHAKRVSELVAFLRSRADGT